MMKYYLKAGGDWCYDRNGLTFPLAVPIPFEAIVREMFETADIRWECQFGWINQPEVLCIDVPDSRPHSRLVAAIREQIIAPCRAAGVGFGGFEFMVYWGREWNAIRNVEVQ
jgi:hypothetical protein